MIKITVLCLITVAIQLPFVFGLYSWTTESNTSLARLGTHVVACDINNDSYYDFASTGFYNLYVWMGNSSYTYNTSADYVIPITSKEYTQVTTDGLGLECFDTNADGYDDIIVGNWTGNMTQYIHIFNGSSSGLITTPTGWIYNSFNNYYGCDLAVADYNNDGKKDLAVGAYGIGKVYLHYGQGTAGLSSTLNNPSALSTNQLTFGENIFACDLSNDSYPDLLIGVRSANSQQGQLYIMGNSAGTWTRTYQWNGTAASGSYGFDAKCGDFNGDGNQDVIILAQGERMLYIHYGTGDIATLSRTPSINISLVDSCRSISIGNLNYDQYDDIVVGCTGVNQVKVYWGGPTLQTGAVASAFYQGPSGNSGFRVLAMPNIDGIGYKEIAFGSYSYANGETSEGSVSVVYNIDPSPTPSTSSSPSVTPSVTPTVSTTPSVSPTPSATSSPTPSPTPSRTPSTSSTPSPSVTPTSSVTPTVSVTPSPSPSVTPSCSITPSVTATPSSSKSPTATRTPSPSISRTPSKSASASPSHSISPSRTPTPYPSAKADTSKSLVTAAVAGLAATAGVIVLFTSGIALYVLRTKKRNRPPSAQIEMTSPQHKEHPSPKQDEEKGTPRKKKYRSADLPKDTQYSSGYGQAIQQSSKTVYAVAAQTNNASVYGNRPESTSPITEKSTLPNKKTKGWIIDYSEIKYAPILFSNFCRMGNRLGAGAFGEVYKAKWRGIDVAVKRLLADDSTSVQTREFFMEAEVMQNLKSHSNITQIFGVCEDPQCIITEFVANGSLHSYLESNPLDNDTMIKIARGIAAGMLHLHSEGVCHRDLAARNILLDPLLNPKVCDFGMSRFAIDNSNNKTANSIGPIRWMAPEALNSNVYNTKTDVWSYGVTLYEIMTRKVPYEGIQLIQVSTGVVKGTLSLVPEVESDSSHPQVLVFIMKQCLQTERNARPAFDQILDWLDTNSEQ